MSHGLLRSLFGYKAWANAELLSLLGTVGDAHGEQRRVCIRTLNHAYVVDRIFRALLSGESRPYEATNTPETPGLDQLRADVAATDAWYLDYADGLAEPARSEVLDFVFTDGDAGRMSREEMLMHVVVHGGYHRGNVGEILKSISIDAPRDLYTRYLHANEPARRTA